MITKLSLSLALALVAVTIASAAFAQAWYSGGRHHYFPRYGSNVAPSHTGGGSFGYNIQVERDY